METPASLRWRSETETVPSSRLSIIPLGLRDPHRVFPSQIQVTGSGQIVSTVTVNTTGLTSTLVSSRLREGRAAIYGVIFPFIGMVLIGLRLKAGDRKRQQLLGCAILCLPSGGLLFQTACSGGTTTNTSPGGTPSGNYTITVTAASGSTQHTASLMLTVQ